METIDGPRYFHVYNRGLDKRTIFPTDSHFERFLKTIMLSRLSNSPKATIYFKQHKLGIVPDEDKLEESWGPPLVNVLAYCLMPNHFHLLLRELVEGGISKFMQRLGDGYTKYFNIRSEREGRLFTARYKYVRVGGDEQLVHVSRYIHLNPHNSSYTQVPLVDLVNYPWASLSNYLRNEQSAYCQPEEVLGYFSSTDDYKKFVFEHALGTSVSVPHDILIDDNDVI